jgi:hypothetical protein
MVTIDTSPLEVVIPHPNFPDVKATVRLDKRSKLRTIAASPAVVDGTLGPLLDQMLTILRPYVVSIEGIGSKDSEPLSPEDALRIAFDDPRGTLDVAVEREVTQADGTKIKVPGRDTYPSWLVGRVLDPTTFGVDPSGKDSATR